MICPNCSTKMEREDHVGPRRWPYTHIVNVPQANYWCEDCGLQADWTRVGNRFTVTWDPRVEGTDRVRLEIY